MVDVLSSTRRRAHRVYLPRYEHEVGARPRQWDKPRKAQIFRKKKRVFLGIKPFEEWYLDLQSVFSLPSSMSPVQEPVCTTDYPRTRIDATLIRDEIVHPDSFYAGTFLEEEDATMRKRAENISQSKLPTYQAAAVVVRMV